MILPMKTSALTLANIDPGPKNLPSFFSSNSPQGYVCYALYNQ
jgi:hypothetical protein